MFRRWRVRSTSSTALWQPINVQLGTDFIIRTRLAEESELFFDCFDILSLSFYHYEYFVVPNSSVFLECVDLIYVTEERDIHYDRWYELNLSIHTSSSTTSWNKTVHQQICFDFLFNDNMFILLKNFLHIMMIDWM